MSTRRTYAAVTRGLKAARRPHSSLPHDCGCDSAAEHVADELAKESPSFDRERFLRDAGGDAMAQGQRDAKVALLAAAEKTANALEAWMEIADEEDQRDSDYEALAEVRLAIEAAKVAT